MGIATGNPNGIAGWQYDTNYFDCLIDETLVESGNGETIFLIQEIWPPVDDYFEHKIIVPVNYQSKQTKGQCYGN